MKTHEKNIERFENNLREKIMINVEPNSYSLSNLQVLFQNINSEISKLLKHVEYKDLESTGLLYAKNIDIEAIKSNEDEEEYHKSLLFTTAHILLSQLFIYKNLEISAPNLALKPLRHIKNLSTIQNCFNALLKTKFEYIFVINVLRLLKENAKTFTIINLVLIILEEFKTYDIQHDLLGFLLQRSIPFNYRKKIGAFYTNIQPAYLLANLAIESANQSVFDPACGSGNLLLSTYYRRMQLDPEINHQKIIESTFGVDISPFACLLTIIKLAMQAPDNKTNECNILLSDVFEFDRLSTLTSFFETYRQNHNTLVSSSIPRTKEFKIPKVDVLIGNPPFTQGDRINPDYKKYLNGIFKAMGYKTEVLIDQKHLGLHGYFLLDIFRHLKSNGTFAYILPYSTLYTESTEPIIHLIRKNFGIRYIIKSEVEPAFSDSTFEEIMLIGSKNYRGSIKVVVLHQTLNNMTLEEISDLSNTIISESSNSVREEYRILILKQNELDNQKWTVFFRSKEFVDLWRKLKSNTQPLHQIAQTIRGNRVAPINLFGVPNKCWRIEKVTSSFVLLQNKLSPITKINIPLDLLYRSMKRYNEMAKYPPIVPDQAPLTFYIRHIPGNEIYQHWLELNKEESEKKLYPPIERLTHLVLPQKIGLTTTKSLAFFSYEPLHVGDGFMSIIMDKENSFLYFSFLSSTFGLLNLLAILRVISGGFGQILGPDMQFLRSPIFSKISNKLEKEIRHQIELLCKTPVEERLTFLEILENVQNNREHPLFQLDFAMAKLLGLSTMDVEELYKVLISELKKYS